MIFLFPLFRVSTANVQFSGEFEKLFGKQFYFVVCLLEKRDESLMEKKNFSTALTKFYAQARAKPRNEKKENHIRRSTHLK